MTLPVPLFCWVIYRHGENISRLFIRAWRKWSRVTDVLSDTIPGIRVVKAFNQEDREIARFGERNEDVTAEFNRIHRSWTTFWPLLILGVHAMTITVWMFAVPRLLGSGHTSVPQMTIAAAMLTNSPSTPSSLASSSISRAWVASQSSSGSRVDSRYI